MSEPRDELILDRLIHEPGRLAILTVLSSVRDADFVFLQRATGLTKGNLSGHLTKLEEAGLVEIEKRFVRKKPNTNVALTAVGKQRIAHHWDQLERLRKLSETTAQQQHRAWQQNSSSQARAGGAGRDEPGSDGRVPPRPPGTEELPNPPSWLTLVRTGMAADAVQGFAEVPSGGPAAVMVSGRRPGVQRSLSRPSRSRSSANSNSN